MHCIMKIQNVIYVGILWKVACTAKIFLRVLLVKDKDILIIKENVNSVITFTMVAKFA